MWHKHTENPSAIEQLFSDAGDLEQVTLEEATLDLQRRLLRLRVELPRFPDRPSARWEATANAVQVTLDCWLAKAPGDTELRLGRFAEQYPGRLELTPMEQGVAVAFTGDDARVRAQCDLVRIAGVSAYHRGEAEL